VTPRARVLGGRYRLVERVDRGGAGEIWRARDERLDRDVAVKLLDAKADDAFRERFMREARRAAAVSHPNVVAVHDEGRDDDEAYMVMEYVRGATLRDLIAERGPLSTDETARLVGQVAGALDAAHAAGVVHCDVKPANVIVTSAGHAKLTDFGVAVAAEDAAERELVGTARYVAPERIAGDAPTARTDVYGLGLVAYELLAGRPAYEGDDTEELLRQRLQGPPPPLRAARATIPAEVDDAVQRALARDPDRRYATAGEFAAALRAAADASDATTPLGPAAAVRQITRRSWTPRADTLIALAAVALVLAAVVALFASFAGAPRPASTATPTGTGAPAATLRAPNVVGAKLDKAIKDLTGAGLNAAWAPATSGSGQPCTVVTQDPAAGATVQRGQRVQLRYISGRNCEKGGD
jgi:serine/threonine-protein kinase